MFEIGIITKAQGIRGEFRVLPTTDDPSRFNLLVGDEIIIRDRASEKKIKLQSARLQKNIVILKLEGIDTRNAAEELTGAIICVEDEKALPLGDDEFFIRDLIGLRVETEDGEHVGEISRVLSTGANDVYVVSGISENFMLPAVKDFVKKISLSDKKIIVRLTEGIRELKI